MSRCHVHNLPLVTGPTDADWVDEVGPTWSKCELGCVVAENDICIVCEECSPVIAGIANALPKESVQVIHHQSKGKIQ